ncbi:Conserved hypothetical protein [Prochlorococcus marinus str. MIT 9303]|uniref:Uncharacterized protein n=1 Tax=Prochlorococcus marinus (strain MIT 9303) TaxID=59922 RepID=A2CAF4_PROM3|nr:Conserved hypothetical protein [Prochlorococcus marinus str. MIT 9303]
MVSLCPLDAAHNSDVDLKIHHPCSDLVNGSSVKAIHAP